MEKTFKKIETCPSQNIFFKSETLTTNNLPSDTEGGVINIFDDVTYQEVLGFGGAFTESSAYLYSLMSDEDKRRFLEFYFDRENGIAYNFGRTHINSCDFLLSIYSSVEEGDKTLETFNLDRERQYILPFLKDALKFCKEEIVLFASPWSPPGSLLLLSPQNLRFCGDPQSFRSRFARSREGRSWQSHIPFRRAFNFQGSVI